LITIAPEAPQQLDLFAQPETYQDNFVIDWDWLKRYRRKANPVDPCELCRNWTWEGNTVHRWGQCSVRYATEHAAKLAAGNILAKWGVDVSGYTLWNETCASFEAAS
jgi:hypothetical protein